MSHNHGDDFDHLCEFDGVIPAKNTNKRGKKRGQTRWDSSKDRERTGASKTENNKEKRKEFDEEPINYIQPLDPPFPYRIIAPDFDFFRFPAEPPSTFVKDPG